MEGEEQAGRGEEGEEQAIGEKGGVASPFIYDTICLWEVTVFYVPSLNLGHHAEDRVCMRRAFHGEVGSCYNGWHFLTSTSPEDCVMGALWA